MLQIGHSLRSINIHEQIEKHSKHIKKRSIKRELYFLRAQRACTYQLVLINYIYYSCIKLERLLEISKIKICNKYLVNNENEKLKKNYSIF